MGSDTRPISLTCRCLSPSLPPHLFFMAEAEGVVDKEGAAAVGKKRARDEVPTAPIADELQLPHASIMRIVKSKLPAGMMVGTDTKKTLSKACSLFVLYLTTMCARP